VGIQKGVTMNECRYHAVGSEVFYKGEKKVRCCDESESRAEEMARDLAKELNYDLETLERFEPKKVRR
jgi:hypothetical protein